MYYIRGKQMIKEYRIWNYGSNQGYYMTGYSPKEAVLHFLMGSDRHDFPIHAILWKTTKDLGSLKMTEQAKKFRDYHGEDKYTKFGRKYYKKDLYPK